MVAIFSIEFLNKKNSVVGRMGVGGGVGLVCLSLDFNQEVK